MVNLTAESGIKAKGMFIFGSPEETMETIEETISFVKKLKISNFKNKAISGCQKVFQSRYSMCFDVFMQNGSP